MKKNNFEVEITGPLDQEELLKVRGWLAGWKYEGCFDRYLINFTTEEMRKNRLDVRARITNGAPELVIKHGEWGSGKRLESVVQCKTGQFLPLVNALLALGFNVGVGARRISERYTKDGMEFAVIEVKDYCYFYEAELMVSQAEQDDAMERLKAWAASKELQVFNKDEYLSFIEDLDANANDLLDTRKLSSLELIEKRINNQP